MNHIILSDKVSQMVQTEYERFVSSYGYTGNIDSFIDDQFSFDRHYKILNRCTEKREYQLIGKNVRLFMEIDRKCSDWFYARRLVRFDSENEYYSKLSQTVDLPGEWTVVLFSDSFGLPVTNTTDIQELIGSFKASYKEFYEFEGKWSTWDLYNSKLKELEEKQEIDSEKYVRSVILENNVFTIRLDDFSEFYVEDAPLCIRFEGQSRFTYIGRIDEVRRDKCEIDVLCDDNTLIRNFNENNLGVAIQARVVDFGTKARLSRQNAAMKKLFQDESSNENLKDILSGDFQWTADNDDEVSIVEASGLFGSNIRQKEAYVKALNAPDLFMIQGPPGTGKTTIITALVRYIISKEGKVLVSSETNIAVDNVLERISRAKGVIPVRLGREERIEDECKKFMPEKISTSIIEDARTQNAFFDENGVNQQALIDKCVALWEKRKREVDDEIDKLKGNMGLDCDIEKLRFKITKYENLLYEINEQHEKIIHDEGDYYALKKKQSELLKEKSNLEERLLLLSDKDFSSGFHQEQRNASADAVALQKKLNLIESKLKDVSVLLSQNAYEVSAASYKRKIRRYEKNKAEFMELFSPCESINARIREIGSTIDDIYVLEEQLRSIENSFQREIESIKKDCERQEKLWKSSKEIRAEWMSAIQEQEVKEDIERIYMRRTNAVFATCTGIASADNGRFADMDYDYVIVDEAAKCNMLDLLIPLTMGKKIILVGDHKQLYPMLETDGLKDELTEDQIRELKEHILFKWLYEESIPSEYKVMLDRQYRMEKNISEFISSRFYDGKLICEKDRENPSSMTWVDCEDSKEEGKGTSFRNVTEAKTVIALLAHLDEEYEKGTSVGIICTYKAQANYIQSQIGNRQWKNIKVECSTVDAFQGKEKHTIIFDIVRSENITGFVKDENRVNVAVSRAQEYLYVVGSVELMKSGRAGVLFDLYNYIRLHGELRNSRYMR